MHAPFATRLLGWKKLEKTGKLVPNTADSDSNTSKLLAGHSPSPFARCSILQMDN